MGILIIILYITYAESNGKLHHLVIPSKTRTFVPEFAVEDLPFHRTAALVPEFAVKDLPLGQNTDDITLLRFLLLLKTLQLLWSYRVLGSFAVKTVDREFINYNISII